VCAGGLGGRKERRLPNGSVAGLKGTIVCVEPQLANSPCFLYYFVARVASIMARGVGKNPGHQRERSEFDEATA